MHIDTIVRKSLTDFVEYVFSNHWYGKEREAISLYAFGHLIGHSRSHSVMYDPRQIGIEVRVRQLPGSKRKKEVCKDLIIWPKPGMTVRTAKKKPRNYPLAVLQ